MGPLMQQDIRPAVDLQDWTCCQLSCYDNLSGVCTLEMNEKNRTKSCCWQLTSSPWVSVIKQVIYIQQE